MKKQGLMLGLFSVTSYSLNTPLSRGIMLEGMTPVTLLLLRFVIAGTVFSLIMRASGLARAKGDDKPMDKRGFGLALIAGLMNGVSGVLYYYGVLNVDASMAAMIGAATYTITALVLGSFLTGGLTPHSILRLALGLIGLYFLLGPSGGDLSLLGASLIAGASFIFGIYLIFVQKFLSDYNISAVSEINLWGIALAIVSFWVMDGGQIQVSSAGGWTVIIIQAIVVSIFGRFSMMAAIKKLGGGEYALLSPLETLLAILWSIIFLSETLSTSQKVGTVFILAGLLVSGEWFAVWFNQLFANLRIPTLRRPSLKRAPIT
ncbi:MAG: DMT family transporter [Chloroflexota bacterium]